MTEGSKLRRPNAVKYEDCKNCHFSGVPGTNVLGATDILFCVTTPRVIQKYSTARKAPISTCQN